MAAKIPRMVAPPRPLLPADVRRAQTVVARWRVFSVVLATGWALGLVVGFIPLVLHLVDSGWQAVLLPGLAMLLGPPVIWGAIRAWLRGRLTADTALVRAWRRFPDDVRWSSSLILADQMDRAAEGDPEVRVVLQRLVGALFGLFAELASLDHSIAADRELAEHGGDPRLHQELITLRTERDAQLSRLVDALRQLHLGFVGRHSAPPSVRAEVAALLDQLDAEREVDGLLPAVEGARWAQARTDVEPG